MRNHTDVIEGDQAATVSATAAGWPVELDLQPTEPGHHAASQRGREHLWQAHLVCGRRDCRQSVTVLALDVDAGAYVLTWAQVAADILRHVRESHCDGSGNLRP
jgi:hypothetical protein